MHIKPVTRLIHTFCGVLFVAFATCKAQASPLLYVANSLGESVSVIDTVSNSVVATIDLPGTEPSAIAMHPHFALAYINNRIGAETLIADTTTHTIIGTIPLPGNPDAGINFHPDGQRLYLTTRRPTNALVVIDTSTNEILATVDRGPQGEIGGDASGVALHPDGTIGYVTFISTDDIWVIDLNSHTAIERLVDPLADGPQGATMQPDGRYVYVPNRNSDNVTIIDTANHAIVATAAVGVQPSFIDFDDNGVLAYVPNREENTVSVIDTASHQVIDTIFTTQAFGMWVEYLPGGKTIYISQDDGEGFVTAVDVASRTEIAAIPVARFPIGATVILPRPEVAGCIKLGGKAIVGGQVQLQQNATNVVSTTDADGCFQFDAVPDPDAASRVAVKLPALHPTETP